jgi:acetyl esterase/lipase
VPNAATDPRIDPQVRTFLAELNKDSSPFWELPQQAVDKPGVLFFIHGGVWIAGNKGKVSDAVGTAVQAALEHASDAIRDALKL